MSIDLDVTSVKESSDGEVGNGLRGELDAEERRGEDKCNMGDDVGRRGEAVARTGVLISAGRRDNDTFVTGEFEEERRGEAGVDEEGTKNC